MLGAREVRRAWDNLCLVTGDGLLPPTDVAVEFNGFFRTAGFVTTLGWEALVMDTLRLERRVFGDEDSIALDRPSQDVSC